jgi:transketolase
MKENVGMRFEAYGWHVQRLDNGNDYQQIITAIFAAQKDNRPSLIIAPTVIGFGCPQKEGKPSAHGEPLGAENIKALKQNFRLPEDEFYVSSDVYTHIKEVMERCVKKETDWNRLLECYQSAYPELYEEWNLWFSSALPEDLLSDDALFEFHASMATRNTSYEMIQRLSARIPNLVGGSADLAPSNKSYIKGGGDYSAQNRLGRNLHFGVREHAMAAIANGLALHGGLRVFCATFFVFSDYMKNAVRMSAIMQLPVVYILTHDSIGVGEDGPTHQPVEQLTGLRAIPGLHVFRPADGRETAAAWISALLSGVPTCLALTRQDLPQYANSGRHALQGAYTLSDSRTAHPDVLLLGSGSEVEPLMEAQRLLAIEQIDARVISVPCMEVFNQQSDAYKELLLPGHIRARVAMEAGSSMPWFRYTGLDGAVIGLDRFGESAPAVVLFEKYGFTAHHAVTTVKNILGKVSRDI